MLERSVTEHGGWDKGLHSRSALLLTGNSTAKAVQSGGAVLGLSMQQVEERGADSGR